eukprot:9493530-Pyramimonas_sp.AAC.1
MLTTIFVRTHRNRRRSQEGHETCAGYAKMGAVGHRTSEGGAKTGALGACERNYWGRRWSSLWSHETCEGGVYQTGAVGACERSR